MKLAIEQLDKLEKTLEEDHLTPKRLTLIYDIIEGQDHLRFYNWYISRRISGTFLAALTFQLNLDHGDDVNFNNLDRLDYKASWNKVLDRAVEQSP